MESEIFRQGLCAALQEDCYLFTLSLGNLHILCIVGPQTRL